MLYKGLNKHPTNHFLLFLCLTLTLCAGVGSSTSAHAQKKTSAPPKAEQVQHIELYQQFPPKQTQALETLIGHFNEKNPNINIKLVQHDWQTKSSPHLLILNKENEEVFLAGKPRFKPLHSVMRESGTPLQALRPPAFMTRSPVNARGQLLALPVGLSTPVLFVNKDAFRHAGLNLDTMTLDTWKGLQDTLGHLVDAGHTCPYAVAEPGWVMVENMSAWHNQPIATVRGKNTNFAFNNIFQVKHIAMMASWKRAQYLHVFDNEQEAKERFFNGECAILAASSSNWPDFEQNKTALDLAVLRLPYHEDFISSPQNTLANGPSMWISAGKRPAEYKAIARFVQFWLQPENQVTWLRESGYLPLNRAGVLAASESTILSEELKNIRVAIKQLTNKPATPYSSAQPLNGQKRIQNILDEELAAVWADHKAAKEALDNAVLRAPKK